MALALKTTISGYAPGDIREAVSFALSNAVVQARQRFEHYRRLCDQFEQKYAMTSDEFAKRFEEGSIEDDASYFDWFAAKRGLDLWRERYEILSGVSV